MISVILPTIRPHLIQRALASIKARTVPIEVIVVADFDQPCEVMPPYVNWLVHPRNGVVDAINVAWWAARGDWIFLTNDETELGEDCLDLLWEGARSDPKVVWSPRHEPPYDFIYYGRRFVPFTFVHRNLVKAIGAGWFFDPRYHGFYADPDLSLRALEKGYGVGVIGAAAIAHRQDHDLVHAQAVSKYLEMDRAAFRARWDHLGVFCDP